MNLPYNLLVAVVRQFRDRFMTLSRHLHNRYASISDRYTTVTLPFHGGFTVIYDRFATVSRPFHDRSIVSPHFRDRS